MFEIINSVIGNRWSLFELAAMLRPGSTIPRPVGPHLFADPRLMAMPALLCIYFIIVWLAVGRNPKLGTIIARYEPPAGISPAEARFILTSGCDRKTVAAALADLAFRKVIAIMPDGSTYKITQLMTSAPEEIPDEEKRVFVCLFPKDAAVPTPTTVEIRQDDQALMTQFASQIYESLNKRLAGKYFTRNLGWTTAGTIAALAWSEAEAILRRGELGFLVLWTFMFSLAIGTLISSNVVPLIGDWIRGELSARNAARTFLLFPIFVGMPLFVDYIIAGKSSYAFGEMIFVTIVLIIVWGTLLKNTTALGLEKRREIEGFRVFLESVEADRLDKINVPDRSPATMNAYLPYAIALDLKEGWGDRLENSLFATSTYR